MIGEILPAQSFIAAVAYVLGEQKVAWIELSANLISADTCANCMEATRRKNPRVKRAPYHMAVSWPIGEAPTDEQMKAIARDTLTQVGLIEHQWLVVCHRDTELAHMHIVANRVHPLTYRAQSLSFDWHKIESVIRAAELRYGFSAAPRLSDLDQIVQIGVFQMPLRMLYARRPSEVTMHAGKPGARPSFESWLQGEPCAALVETIFTGTASWGDVHRTLAQYGLWYQRTPRGGRIVEGLPRLRGTFGTAASKMARFASLPNMEYVLGPYEEDLAPMIDCRYTYSKMIKLPGYGDDLLAQLMDRYEAEAGPGKAAYNHRRDVLEAEQRQRESARRTAIRSQRKNALRSLKGKPRKERALQREQIHQAEHRDLARHYRMVIGEKAALQKQLATFKIKSLADFIRRLAREDDPIATAYLLRLRERRDMVAATVAKIAVVQLAPHAPTGRTLGLSPREHPVLRPGDNDFGDMTAGPPAPAITRVSELHKPDIRRINI